MLSALTAKDASIEFEVWCDKPLYSQTVDKLSVLKQTIPVKTLSSGKFRRYHSLPLWRQLLRVRTIVIPNVIDSGKIVIGIIQSYVRLRRNRPDVIFCKGGFVCLPAGIAAKWLSIPVVLHDSDVHPGLTNRVLSQSARFIGTGAPLENYNYDSKKARYVGVPVDERFVPISVHHMQKAKESIGFAGKRPLVVVTGGGLGAKSLNEATLAIIDELLIICDVLLIAGTANYDALKNESTNRNSQHFKIEPFIGSLMVETLQAADVVVARAGATTLLELAGLAKPTIIVPNPYLTGGHQTKNAAMYEKNQAAIIVDERSMVAKPYELLDAINALVLNPAEMTRMGQAMHRFAKPNAAHDMAQLILDAANKQD